MSGLKRRIEKLEEHSNKRGGRLLIFYYDRCDTPSWDGTIHPDDICVRFESNVDLAELERKALIERREEEARRTR